MNGQDPGRPVEAVPEPPAAPRPRRSVRDLVRIRRSRLLRLAAAREHASRPYPGGGPDLHDLASMTR